MTTQAAIFRSGPLDENKAGDPLAYVSPSRLKSFLTCRLRFFYEKVLGLKAPSSPNLQIGKAVHAGLQTFHTAKWHNQELSRDEVLEAYDAAYRELEEQDPVEYAQKSREDCVDTGLRVLSAYLDTEYASDPRKILGVEVYLRAEQGLPLPLVGILDLVVEGNVPVDFKTIGNTPNLEEEAWQNELQLTAYHLLLEDAVGESPAPGELIYLAKLKTPKVIRQVLPPVDQKAIDRLKALTEAYAEGITREEFYPSPGMHCRWCPFRAECRAWAGQTAIAA